MKKIEDILTIDYFKKKAKENGLSVTTLLEISKYFLWVTVILYLCLGMGAFALAIDHGGIIFMVGAAILNIFLGIRIFMNIKFYPKLAKMQEDLKLKRK